ncbi:hypothetical protein MJO28_012274 [Puccinia striiformis f. sp. tritici]|uniref:Uncharacterized protein n=1 Tax=Puccinia striiformis f. sp. tritici TaxID=168172 RepID=A0ACC0E003_9BASI|nr:hypothetical protein Pst134EA_022847 [Puccinia striiformis f. sp. tritici]KAH9445875.1 hypothetical protein Pst134EB_023708 [Puccinia striiformis f. sp. tritici]KAH9455378.1 hypothetical protein Pst134EA_022847 [Puccinia striiformis f. sp. tritici]KAI7942247.1 hypothetical protein MJO28_012274 [Puccinia striiformis f. sp. tritici]
MGFSLDECIKKLLTKQLLAQALIKEICEKTKELVMRESNVVHISAPVTVVGDIHGQFYDLIEIFRIGAFCPDTNYLLLDFVQSEGIMNQEQSHKLNTYCNHHRPTRAIGFTTLIIEDRIFCVHGGLSPSIHCINQIKVIDRFREIPHEGPMADLVWSDPDPDKEDFACS